MAETEIIIRPQKSGSQTEKNLLTAEQSKPQNGTAEKTVLETALEAGMADQAALEAAQAIRSPEDYVFRFSPETVVDELLVEDFRRFAFEQKMSLENARLMAEFYEKYVQGQCRKQRLEEAERLKNMCRACEEDSEYGGLDFHGNMRYARAAMLRFDDGSLAKILNETGFGSHPEVVRFMYRVGRALAEKDMPRAKEAKQERSAAELFYPSMKKGI